MVKELEEYRSQGTIKDIPPNEKKQYYTSAATSPEVSMQKASYFLEKLVKPYLKLVEELMKNKS